MAKAKKAVEKNDDLDFLKSLQKDFKTTATIIEDDLSSFVPWKVPFKHYALQKITGGLLGGKIMSIDAESQCLAEGTLVATPTGPRPIQELKVGDLVIGYEPDGSTKPTRVKRVTNTGVKPVHQLWNNHLSLAESTLDHTWGCYYVRNGQSRFVEKTTEQLTNNSKEYRVVRRFIDYSFGDRNEPHAYAIGALTGDGCSRQGVSNIQISSKNSLIPNKVGHILGVPHVYKNNKQDHTYVLATGRGKGFTHETVNCNYYTEVIKGKYAYEKDIPSDWRSWNRESILSLLAGLIDTDGSVVFSKKRYLSIEYTTTSPHLAKSVFDLIYEVFQVTPSIHEDRRGGKNRKCYSVRVADNFNASRILKALDPHIVTKSKKHKTLYDSLSKSVRPDCIGLSLGGSRMTTTWDISVSNTTRLYVLHNNGLVTHNCGKSFLLYELLGSCIREGGWGYLVDTERAFEPAYGTAAGMDFSQKRFLVGESTVIEDLSGDIETFIKRIRDERLKDPSKPLVVGLDSTAGTRCREQYTNDEKGKDTGYGFMKRANAMYEMLDKIIPVLDEYAASLVVVGQLRKKTNCSPFENPYKTMFENIEYRATQMLRGYRRAVEKNEEDKAKKLGMNISWETYKNRFVKPKQTIALKYHYEKGLLPYSGLSELLIRDGLVTKAELKDPNDARKKIKGLKVGDEFFPISDGAKMLEAHPYLLEPVFVQVHEGDDSLGSDGEEEPSAEDIE